MLFARYSKKTGIQQPLKDHLNTVAQLTKNSLQPMGFESLGELLGCIHDFGKIAPQWQEYLLTGKSQVNHSSGGIYFIQRITKDFPPQPTSANLLQMIELAIQGHHGGLRDALSSDGMSNRIEENVYSTEELAEMDQWFFQEIRSKKELETLWEKANTELVTLLQQIKNNTMSVQTPTFSESAMQCKQMQLGLLQRFVFSALVDADRFDAGSFEQEPPIPPSFSWEELIQTMEKIQRPTNGINKYRQQIALEAKSFPTKQQGIYQFPAPTGAGKNLSSLGFALETARKYDKSRIFFIAPFLSIIEQNAQSVRDTLELEKDSPLLLEHHSNFQEEEKINHKNEQVSTRELATERWDSPIIFTSMVQFLHSGFRGDSVRRLQGLVNSVIIIDEVQSVPRHCLYFFHSFLHFLRDYCHCVILVTTATPPTLPDSFFQLEYDTPKAIANISEEIHQAFLRTYFEVLKGTWEDNQVTELVLEKQKEFQSVLLIVNTKSTAYSIYSSLKDASSATLIYLSTELCPAHRKEKIKLMKKLLKEQKPVICISTQLIEAGVDVSFPTVIRSLAGLDSLIQAAGRCNRHGERELSPVFVLRISSERLDALPEIYEGKEVTNRLIECSPNLPLDKFETMDIYFKNFFNNHEEILNNQLFKQFGGNSKGRNAYGLETKQQYPKMLAQAFQSVGKKFKAIQDNTTGIVVPYGDCEELLEEWKTLTKTDEKRKHLRKLQAFTVNVYQYKLAQLTQDACIYYD